MCRDLQLRAKYKKQAGFSLVEVLVATALFAGMVSVLLATFINAKRLAEPALVKGTAANLARAELDKLYNAVDQSTWNLTDVAQNPIPPSTESPTTVALSDLSLNGKTFQRSYVVSPAEGHAYRRIVMKVNEKDV